MTQAADPPAASDTPEATSPDPLDELSDIDEAVRGLEPFDIARSLFAATGNSGGATTLMEDWRSFALVALQSFADPKLAANAADVMLLELYTRHSRALHVPAPSLAQPQAAPAPVSPKP